MDFYGPLSIFQSFSPSVDIQEVPSTGQGQSWCQETHDCQETHGCPMSILGNIVMRNGQMKKKVILANET